MVVTPGPDTALVISHALTRGPRAAREAALGVNSGILIHAAAAAIGLSALLVASSVAFTIVKLAGAAFLVYLGAKMLLALRGGDTDSELTGWLPSTRIASRPYWQGFWSNVLNPKVALLFLALLPQFIDEQEAMVPKTLLYAGVFITMGLIWLLSLAAIVARLADVFRSARLRRRLQAMSGGVLVALGVRVAVDR